MAPASEKYTLERPTWDSTPIKRHAWLVTMYQYLVQKDKDYRSLASEGYVMSRHHTVVPTEFHGCHLRDGLVEKGSLADPLPLDIFDDLPLPVGMAPLGGRYEVSYEAVKRVDEAMCEDVLNGIESKSERDAWSDACGATATGSTKRVGEPSTSGARRSSFTFPLRCGALAIVNLRWSGRS